MKHQYPRDLAEFVHSHWTESNELPSVEALADLLSTCYQASLLTEEGHSVTFRVALLRPEELPLDEGPPTGYHRIRFCEPRALAANALRKLSPAAEFSHALVGLQLTEVGFQIWGLVHSGPRWFNSFYNSRRAFHPLPKCLVVSVNGPGRLSVSSGSMVVARLSGGQVSAPGRDVLASKWLREVFLSVRDEIHDLRWDAEVSVDARVARRLTQTMLRRSLQLLTNRRQGGAFLIVPPDMGDQLEQSNPYLQVRFRIQDEEPRRRFRTLMLQLLHRLCALCPNQSTVGWQDYLRIQDSQLNEVGEAMEEFSQLLANLASVDGAVLLTNRIELLGFGVEIAGNLPTIASIRRATDIEAHKTVEENTENVGTRHRSAYRLCAQLDQVLALIHSQDRRIQLVKQVNGQVTCWDQLATGARDL